LDFQLNDEQLQLKKSVREFAEREIAPHVMTWDEASEFPMAIVKELGKPRGGQFKDWLHALSFSADGRWLAYVSNRPDGVGVSDIWLYDRKNGKGVAVPELNSPGMDITPSLSGDGNLVAFASDRPGGKGGRDIYLFDRQAKKFRALPGLNSPAQEQTPGLSADGRYIVFVSERFPGEGERDIFLYDREAGKLLPTPGLNSKREDIDPCVIVVK